VCRHDVSILQVVSDIAPDSRHQSLSELEFHEFAIDLGFGHSQDAPWRYMFSRPVGAKGKPVATSSSDSTLP
jgi:hypothetical protein